MIACIRFTVDGKTYTLDNDGSDEYKRKLTAPDTSGRYDLMLEIVEESGRKTYIDSSNPNYDFYLNVINKTTRRTDLLKYLNPLLQDIFEIRTIIEIENVLMDKFYEKTDAMQWDLYIDTSSNEMVTRLEKFFKVRGEGTLKERKNYLLALLCKGSKIDEVRIKNIIRSITGEDCVVKFYASDEENNPYKGYGLLSIFILNELRSDWGAIKEKYKTWKDVELNFASWEYVLPFQLWHKVLVENDSWMAVKQKYYDWRGVGIRNEYKYTTLMNLITTLIPAHLRLLIEADNLEWEYNMDDSYVSLRMEA